MQKRIKIVCISIVVVVLLIGIITINNNFNNNYSFKEDGIKYALTLDDEKITSFPSKGLYKVQVTCDGADGKWLYDKWTLSIRNITKDNASCNISFNTITRTNLNDYIISLSGTTQGTGQVVNENGYRYEGKSPNNYVWFNNEYWRIIGVFDSNTHGQSGKNLVKIIRDETIDGIAWHKSNTNDWSASSLKSLLNGAYYNAQDGTSSGNCYGYSTTLSASCDYTKIGIQDEYRNMIVNATWRLGGYSGTGATTANFYSYERGSTVYSGRPTSTTGYIGLLYPSDYGYSVLASSCARTTGLNAYNTTTCAGASWLFGKGHEWTITPNSSNSNIVFILYYYGFLYTSYTYFGCSLRPTLYLDSSVYKIDGDGSLENPYIIGM